MEKRKRLEEGVVTDGKKVMAAAVEEKKKKKKDDKKENEEEGEVEEFFAILKRIRVAFKYFESGGNGRQTTEVRLWNPNFQPEDFEEDNNNRPSVLLDLNAAEPHTQCKR